MSNFNVGDFIYFSTSNSDVAKLFKDSGIIINISDGIFSVLNGAYSNTIYNLTEDNIRLITDRENIINELNTYYDKEVEKYQSQIKSVKREYYNDEIVTKYNNLKQEIINTSKNMINSKDDEEFENKLKAICQKKKELFAIECEGMNNARKFNGEIKYKIKELNKMKENNLKYLDKSIDELKNNFKK